MGFFSDIFGSSSTEQVQSLKRRKALRNRLCRVEEMEPRELLSATPYEAPDAINVGVVYHEDYYDGYQNGVEDAGGDTFLISWTGGAEGTTLDKVVIDLTKITGKGSTANLFFNPDGQKRPNGFGTYHDFDYDLVDNYGNEISAKATVSEDGKTLTIDFMGFTSEKVFYFKIDVDEYHGGTGMGMDRHVSGKEMEGAHVTSYFSAENYEDVSTTTMMTDEFRFDEKSGLDQLLPGDEYTDPSTPDTVNTAGTQSTLDIQTPLKGSISGYVYEDVNNDGVKDPNEKGIGGVQLELFYKDASGKYVSTGLTTKTLDDGSYKFNDIPGGVTYMVVETQPTAYADGLDTPGTIGEDRVGESSEPDRLTEIHIGANEHGYNYNFGELKRASISGYVYHDRNNDGVRDSGEEGIQGVTVKLQVLIGGSYVDVSGQVVRTDADGKYSFEGLDPFQTYRVVEVDQPSGYSDGKESVGWIGSVDNPVGRLPVSDNDTITNIFIGYDEHGQEYNFGEFKKGSIGGTVYEDTDNDGTKDPGEPGIPGVEVWLCILDENGNKVNIRSTTTDENGNYYFGDLDPGQTYCVTEVDPKGYCDGETSVGTVDGEHRGSVNVDVPADKDQIHDIYIGSGEDGVNYNFAENRYATLGGYVYVDGNKNGMKDAGEIGLKDVLLTLWVWSEEANGYVQTQKSAMTDANGYYEFTELCPFKKFQVREAQPEDYDDGDESVGTVDGKLVGKVTDNDVISDIVLTPGSKGENYNFGEIDPPKPGSLSGYVYVDANKNGMMDGGEKGIAGVTLHLWKLVDGSYIDTGLTATTDSHGYYLFTNLAPNETYMIAETQPTAYDDGEETVGSLGGRQVSNDKIENILVGSGEHGIGYNFGELEKEKPVDPEKGSLSGYVYVDANKNGTKDTGETGIGGVTLTLWKLVNGEYVNTGKTATTNASGYYIFSSVDPNETYMIKETQPAAYDDGAESVGSLGGTLPAIDNDTIMGIFVGEGRHGTNYNFGEHIKDGPVDPEKGSISGHVYVDANKNGKKDSGEKGISGVTITLWKLVDGEYVKTGRTTTTDSNGYYIFTDLDPEETYMVAETQPTAYDDGAETVGSLGGTLPSKDNDTIMGIFVGDGQHGTDYNFGEHEKEKPVDPEKGSLSGYVYVDINKNGKKDSGEKGIGGVTLTLWILEDGEYVYAEKTAKTDSRGFYIFTDLDPNETYMIAEQQPANYLDGSETVGSLGGELPMFDNDTITAIKLGPGQHGTNYNFGEIYPAKNNPTPPSPVVIQGNGGAATGVGAAPHWQPPLLSASLQAGYGGGGLPSGYSWHLSVVNAGYPRTDADAQSLVAARTTMQKTMLLNDTAQAEADLADAQARYVSVAWTPLPMSQSVWYVRGKDGKVTKKFKFGPEGGIPLAADFSGDGTANLAVYHNGNWYIDLNGNGVWDEEDLWCQLGSASDQPVVGDWDGDGKADIGIFGAQWSGDAAIVADEPGLPSDLNVTITARPKNMPPEVAIDSAASNVRAMKHSNRGQVRLDVIDHVFQYGGEGDRAFTGDFSGDGITKIGIYRNGKWYIDHNGNGRWDEGDIYVDSAEQGVDANGIPVVGDWNGDGVDKIGVYVNGVWHLDTTGDFLYDTQIEFGQAGDTPVVGDFDGDGIAELAVYRSESADSLMARSTPNAAPAVVVGQAAPLYANAPQAARAGISGRTAAEFGTGQQDSSVDQGTLPEELQRHGRSMKTPHTSAPLHRHR